MKKIISMILVITIVSTSINTAFAFSDSTIPQEQFEKLASKYETVELLQPSNALGTGEITGYEDNGNYANSAMVQSRSTLDNSVLSKLNTVTLPEMSNGANEPKLSYNSFIDENISDYSGELTLNFEDITLDGRNGLDLRIGTTYQSTAAWLGRGTVIRVPHESGQLVNTFVYSGSPYLIDRYNLGVGWSFNFPSVQIETEYTADTIQDMYHYDKETELYYHSGNGDVYRVAFTADTTDSNLEGYYKKDICFSENDTSYTNGQVASYYSLTLSDKTKQYFAEDGRLIGIVDRFGNEIKFEHTMYPGANLVPGGSFNCDNKMWLTSLTDDSNDAEIIDDCEYGDGYAMYFWDSNPDETYIMSLPIQVIPNTTCNFEMTLYGADCPDISLEFLYYDIDYNLVKTENRVLDTYDAANGYKYTCTTAGNSQSRYLIAKISPDYAGDLYIDDVSMYYQRPLISKITDTIGRTVEFAYNDEGEQANISLTIRTPDNLQERTLTYYKIPVNTQNFYMGNSQIVPQWYLSHSDTQGEDGSPVYYEYLGGHNGSEYIQLYIDYESKQHSSSDGKMNRPLLSGMRYKDRHKVYEYETIRKHMGEYGYYDTLRVKKKYEMCRYADDTGGTYFDGEINPVVYTYGGVYNDDTYDNETGYPNYVFDDTSNLNEQWNVTKTGKNIETTVYSNCQLIGTSKSCDGTSVTFDYTNHSTFKDLPIQIKSTVSNAGGQRETYIFYTYNDKGLVESETKEVDADIAANNDSLQKYTTYYE
ncbi:MAG: hypothetical protein IJ365_06805 [Clostridia bacterium]|nr:hypothetical protein [Clostridia bacterium]